VCKKVIEEISQVFHGEASLANVSAHSRVDPSIVGVLFIRLFSSIHERFVRPSLTRQINQLDCLTCVIKEVLRIFTPASTLRHTTDKSTMVPDPSTGQPLPISNWIFWPMSLLIHRNKIFFPDVEVFVPERFMASQTPYPDAELFTAARKDAWRPFEKGPRSCIGEQLAMIESKIILALLVPEFDFVAEVNGVILKEQRGRPTIFDANEETKDTNKQQSTNGFPTVEGYAIYQMLKGTAKPAYGMPGRIYLRSSAQ
jgi:hypothetical protein